MPDYSIIIDGERVERPRWIVRGIRNLNYELEQSLNRLERDGYHPVTVVRSMRDELSWTIVAERREGS